MKRVPLLAFCVGNLESKRDWGFAGDYVKAMWLMLQGSYPKDYVVATGKSYSVRDLCSVAFCMLDLDYRDYVKIDKRYYRPTEVDALLGDSKLIKSELGWKAETQFNELIEMMVKHDYDAVV